MITRLTKPDNRFRATCGDGIDRIPRVCTLALVLFAWSMNLPPVAAQSGEDSMAVRSDLVRTAEGCEAAIKLYRRAVAEHPEDGLSHYWLGYCLHTTGKLQQATDAHRRAARFSAYQAEALYNLAAAYALLGRRDDAIAALTRSIDLGVRDRDQDGYRIARESDFDTLRSDPRFLRQLQRLAGEAFSLEGPPEWQPTRSSQAVATVLDVIENRHPNPYRYFGIDEFRARAESIGNRAEGMSAETFALELMRLVAMVGDVHTSIWVASGSGLLTDVLPLRLWKFADGLFVRAASPEHADLVGARVLRMGRFDVEQDWSQLVAENPRENESMATGWLQFLLLHPAFHVANGWSETPGRAELEIVDRLGIQRTVALSSTRSPSYGSALESSLSLVDTPDNWLTGWDLTDPPTPRPTWLEREAPNYRFERVGDRATYHLAVNLARSDPEHPWQSFLGDLFAAIRKTNATRLIVDLRHNPGGWGYMAHSLVDGIRRTPALDRPGGVCVLTSRTTQSAGVTFSVLLERDTHAVFAGEPGGAAPNFYNGPQGHFSPQAIPGIGLRIKHSTAVIQDSDQRDTRRAIAPDLPVPLSHTDYASGQDAALQACIVLDDKKALGFFQDPGGRTLPRYDHWRRPSQYGMFPHGPPRDY